jgi:nitroreductase
MIDLVELGTWAPTGGNAQTWRFVVINEATTIEAIHAVSPGIGSSPPAIIAICQDRELAGRKSGAMGRDRCAPMDAAMAAQTIMLAAHTEGLGTCAVLSFHPQAVQRILGLPETVIPELLVTVGQSAHAPAPPAREIEGIIFVNRWGHPVGGASSSSPIEQQTSKRGDA